MPWLQRSMKPIPERRGKGEGEGESGPGLGKTQGGAMIGLLSVLLKPFSLEVVQR